MAPERAEPKSKLQEWFPNVKQPVIISAPMLGVSNGTLAAHVSKAGGLGIIPGGADFTPGSAHLANLEKELIAAREILGIAELTLTPAPVGVGFITASPSVSQFKETALPLLEKYMPQAVWLFAPDPAAEPRSHPGIITALHEHGFQVFVQVGTVAAAREAVQDGADVIVAQGVDAGGHQFQQGAGVISLVPEIRAMLDRDFPSRGVVLVAAGGISEAGGVVAALALGAEAAVMGTRFIVAREALSPEVRRKVILETQDGGVSTVKSYFHDDVQGTTIWPKLYDGRAIIGDSYKDHASGLPIEENIKKLKEAKDAGDNSRLVHWAGTGVGLVTEELPAGDIVRFVRDAARERLQKVHFLLDDDDKNKRDKSWIKELGQTLYKHR
ncbi:putative 2-nitropropane dioxygenase protein [Phaeoacremonium minimum UCRPA7]|uniref:Putative 2-nitropropane dioxygenase protein n=1 Tax=Phaeoacremonium minimum (strain UCR-PA7) TaxID=1286976 RepID=R8BLX1_PHAM7|nr:putative 2-nitropropane dioxygenase protein [Phaeoacremonium minimum UCRPA7]EOO00344.1 putative 2-nitropropane dioxygenase protein [Phaeoacremonium minimum UCRPA7]